MRNSDNYRIKKMEQKDEEIIEKITIVMEELNIYYFPTNKQLLVMNPDLKWIVNSIGTPDYFRREMKLMTKEEYLSKYPAKNIKKMYEEQAERVTITELRIDIKSIRTKLKRHGILYVYKGSIFQFALINPEILEALEEVNK